MQDQRRQIKTRLFCSSILGCWETPLGLLVSISPTPPWTCLRHSSVAMSWSLSITLLKNNTVSHGINSCIRSKQWQHRTSCQTIASNNITPQWSQDMHHIEFDVQQYNMSCGQQLGHAKYCESQWEYEKVRNHSLHRSILGWLWHIGSSSQIPIEIVVRDTPRLKWQSTSIPTIYVEQNESEIEQETAQCSHTILQQQNIDCDATAWQPFCTCCPNKNRDPFPMSGSDGETDPTNWIRGIAHVCYQNDPLWLEMALAPLPMLPNGNQIPDPNQSESVHIGFVSSIWEMESTLRTQLSPNWRLPPSLPLSLDQSRRIASFCEHEQIRSDLQIENNHNHSIPESRRLAWMESAQLFFSLTSWPEVSQQTEMFLCKFARHSRSQQLRCCSDLSTSIIRNSLCL